MTTRLQDAGELPSGVPEAETLRAAVDKFAESPSEHSALMKIVDLLERHPIRPDQSLLVGPKL